MERRVRGNSHARCGQGEKMEIISKSYLLVSIDIWKKAIIYFLITLVIFSFDIICAIQTYREDRQLKKKFDITA